MKYDIYLLPHLQEMEGMEQHCGEVEAPDRATAMELAVKTFGQGGYFNAFNFDARRRATVNENEEAHYERGSRAAWLAMLQQCLQHLGYKSEEGSKVAWIMEREQAVAMLRRICAQHGDNDWPENLHLADVIAKHLWRNLEEKHS